PEAECRQAGVLIPFIRKDNQWHILYIRRAILEGDHHSGQVAFAGGKHEEQDADLQATALREAHEEIGIQPHHVNVLGELNHHYSITRFKITPVVGYLAWPYPVQVDQSEVAKVFSIPLLWLADPGSHRIEHRQLGSESVPVVYFNEYDHELLWGATARMTLSLIACLGK
ncbi:MAG: CoA pyrophosphatase, partial [Proteobacteria bacterium]|nr:CoA pyrophosphatase [Pseudomonadota bacterium]